MSDSDPRFRSDLATLEAQPAATPRLLASRLADDPWALTHSERLELRASLGAAQVRWLTRLGNLIDPPAIDDSFPAYLLGTPPFSLIGQSIGEARNRHELDTGTADEVQRFVDHYRSYQAESTD